MTFKAEKWVELCEAWEVIRNDFLSCETSHLFIWLIGPTLSKPKVVKKSSKSTGNDSLRKSVSYSGGLGVCKYAPDSTSHLQDFVVYSC